MKKSKEIILTVVIASVLTACSNTQTPPKPQHSRFHVRADTTNTHYSTQRNHGSYGHAMYYGMRFIPSGIFSGGSYRRSGFYNSRTFSSSTSHGTPHVTTGGFGRTGHGGFHASS